MRANSFFITGTDTEVGKTYVTCALLRALGAAGLRAVGMKPIASGCTRNVLGGLQSEDAMAHAAAANVVVPAELASPYCFEPAVSPHLAARDAGVVIDFAHLAMCCTQLVARADIVLVEGAGGWLAPIDDRRRMADMALALRLPVVLVVGMRLGCLNHAMLSAESIVARGATLVGWVANFLDPDMARVDENLAFLKQALAAPLLGVVGHGPDSAAIPSDFRPEVLLTACMT